MSVLLRVLMRFATFSYIYRAVLRFSCVNFSHERNKGWISKLFFAISQSKGAQDKSYFQIFQQAAVTDVRQAYHFN